MTKAFLLTLGNRLLPVTPPDPDSVNDVTLLGLVTESPGLVRSGRTGCTVDDRELTVFPASKRIGFI